MEKFKQPEDIYTVRNEKELDSPIVEGAKKYLADLKNNEIADIEKKSLSISENLGKEIEPKIKKLYERTTQFFKERGFDVSLLPVYLVPFSEENHNLGVTKSTHIEMPDLDMEGRTGKKEITFMKVMGHELYHSVAQRSLDIRKANMGHEIVPGGFGASYNPIEGTSPALEEGMAVLFENKIFQQTKNDLPKYEVESYNDSLLRMLRSRVETNYKYYFNEDMVDVAHIAGIKRNSIKLSFSIDQYFSKKLAEYLMQEIPDLERLIEDARLNRHTIGLAKAIEKRFGEGAYRKITTTPTSEAHILLKELGYDLSGIEFPDGSEISLEKKEAVQELLNNELLKSDQKKANILLAAQGVKPVSEFGVGYIAEQKNEVAKIEQALKKLGLSFLVETKTLGYKDLDGNDMLSIYEISLDQKKLEELETIKEKQPPVSSNSNFDNPYYYETGRIFGFPETAIDAFCKGKVVNLEDINFLTVTTARVRDFVEKTKIFRLSVDNWQLELKTIELWVKAIDKIAPGYIDSFIEKSG